MDIIKRISDLKNLRGWSVNQLATEAALPQSTVQTWFGGHSTPSFLAVNSVCEAFGITLSQFFNEEDNYVSLTESQKGLLEQWDILNKDEKAALLNLVKTLNFKK